MRAVASTIIRNDYAVIKKLAADGLLTVRLAYNSSPQAEEGEGRIPQLDEDF